MPKAIHSLFHSRLLLCCALLFGFQGLNAQLSVSLQETDPVCFGLGSGSIVANVTGGNGSYSYQWSNGATTAFIENLNAGNYSLTVTDGNGVQGTASATLVEPPQITLDLSADQECTEPFVVTATGGGGVPPYIYNWSTGASTQSITVPSGSYCVTIVDNNLCGTFGCITVEVNPPSVSVTAVDVTCFGGEDGSLTAFPTSGTPPYTYLWSNGGTTQTISNLTAGNYTVTITDAGGCSASATGTVNQPPQLNVSLSQDGPVCVGEFDATITAFPSGGTSPYTYLWSTGATTQAISGVGAGTYTVTVTDANQCTTVGSTTVLQAPSPDVAITGDEVICGLGNTGELTAVPSGGTPGYLINWSTGAVTATITNIGPGTYTVTVTDANGCTDVASATLTLVDLSITLTSTNVSCNGFNDGSATVTGMGGTTPYTYMWSNGATTQTIDGLAPGTYSVTLTEADNCKASGSVTITEPPALQISGSVVNPECADDNSGSIDLFVSGGTAPYTYQWSNGASTQDISNLTAGTYTVTVTDANNCTATATFTLTDPPALVATAVATDVDCFGNATGSIDLTVSGGTPPYTYDWSNDGMEDPDDDTQDLFDLIAATYQVTVTDANGCTVVAQATVNQPPALNLTTQVTDILCFGQATGAVDLTVSGGTAPYAYSWSNGSNSQDLDNLAAGTYTVTVTDANECSATATVTVDQPTQLVVTGTVDNVDCFGGNDGAIDLTVTGGTAPYFYNWDNGANTQDLTNLTAGTYNVTVTDSNNCGTIATFTVTQPTDITLTTIVTDVDCAGDADGAIDLIVSGGTPPYTYDWDNDGSDDPDDDTQDLSDLSGGTYTVTVTDANGCTATATATVEEPDALNLSTTSTDLDCFGDNDGSIDLTVSGGTAPYTYVWSNGSNTQDLNNLTAGTYTVTVTDANGCTATTSVTITQPTELTVTANSGNVNCFGGSDGFIDITVSGGTAPYSYDWSNGANTEDLAAIPAGTYTVTVTDNNGCTATISVTITQPTDISLTTIVTDVDCAGDADGAIDLIVSGGTPPYTYDWDNDGSDDPDDDTQDLSDLSGGTYTVTVTDANGCTATATATVEEPDALNLSTTSTDLDCFGDNDGSIDLTVSGGTAPYTYDWSNGSNNQDLNNLIAGTYTVTVTDANGCTATTSITITQPTELTVTANSGNVNCFGGSDGFIDITVSGGTAPYSYDWSNGANTEDLAAIPAGTYTVTVTDDNGCVATISVTITQPTDITLTTIVTDVDCAGDADGAIDLIVSGGTPPYTYDWDNDGSDDPDDDTQDLSDLSGGTYTVTVTDANGCTATATATVEEPDALNLSTTSTDLDCFGDNDGSIDLTVSGGTAPYTYAWSNGSNNQDLNNLTAGTYTVTVTDANGCTATTSVTITQPTELTVTANSGNVNCFGGSDGFIDITVNGGTAPYSYDWSNGANTEDLAAIPAGTYTVTVTDNNGCVATISVTITQPTDISLTTIVTDIACAGDETGSIDLIVSGGTPPYTYDWDNDGSDDPDDDTQDLSDLSGGTYTVTVTDANGCTATATATVEEPDALNLSTTSTDLDCFGDNDGSIDLTVSGGTAPYTYAWSNGSNNQDLNNLTAGTYMVTVTDANGCTATTSVTITQPTELTVTANSGNVNCFGGSDGFIDITVSGGTAPYSYDWSNGANTEDLAAIPAGTYTVTVTDNNGCTATISVTITQPTDISLTTIVTDIACAGDETGSIDLIVSGGTPPYTYDWDNDGSDDPDDDDEDLTDLAAGTYTVTVTDANGCTATATATVNETSPINLTGVVTNVDCFGDADGSINITVSGGSSPYAYVWSNGAMTQDLNGLSGGTYTVVVTDANECTATATFTVTEAPEFTLDISAPTITCGGTNSGSILATPVGGTGPYTYLWSNGAMTSSINDLPAGIYSVTVTDANGCTATATNIQLSEIPELTCTVTVNQLPTTGNNGSLTVNVDGGTAPFTYEWSNGGNTQTIDNLTTGTYSVTVTDANNCTTVCSATLQPTAKIGDFVWNDTNFNGIQDPGEPGIPGVTVTVTSQDGLYTDTQLTDGNGMYMFMVFPGTYKVTFSQPEGLVASPQDQGGNDALDSDIDPVMLMTGFVTVGENEMNLTLDAGFYDICIANVDDPGTIGFDQVLCGPGNVPDLLVELTPATGGVGELNYLWMMNTVDPNQDISFWTPVPNSNSPNLQLGPIYESTYYARCVRRNNCVFLESNSVFIEVGDDADAVISGPNVVCEQTSVTYFAVGAENADDIQWSFSGPANVTNNPDGSVTVNWGSFGLFSATLSVTQNGCTATRSMAITVITNPASCGNGFMATGNVDNLVGRQVSINWTLPMDGSDLTFTVERSFNGIDFETVGTVTEPLQLVNGNMGYYHFPDVTPLAGVNYYRVWITDELGNTTVSNTIELSLSGNVSQMAQVYPNPVTGGMIHVQMLAQLDNDNIIVQLYNSTGYLISTQSLPSGTVNIDLPLANQPSGVYMIRIVSGDVTETHQILVD